MGLVIQEGRPSLLSFEEREICSRISTGDSLDGQRALALLALDDGMTQANAAAQAGLTHNQVKYCLTLFRRQRLDMFPPELLADPVELVAQEADAPPPIEPVAQEADAPPSAADEAAAEESPTAAPLPQKATAEEKKAKKSSDKEEKPKKQTESKKDNGKKGKSKKSKGKKGPGKKKAKKDKNNGKGGKKSKKKKKKK